MKFRTGRVIDLVSNDVQRLEDTKWPFRLITASIDLIVVSSLLCYLIGWQALVGMLFLLLLVPFFGLLSSAAGALRLRTAAVSDRRISMMNEILCGIPAIKINTWEDAYREKIKVARRYVEENTFYVLWQVTHSSSSISNSDLPNGKHNWFLAQREV